MQTPAFAVFGVSRPPSSLPIQSNALRGGLDCIHPAFHVLLQSFRRHFRSRREKRVESSQVDSTRFGIQDRLKFVPARLDLMIFCTVASHSSQSSQLRLTRSMP